MRLLFEKEFSKVVFTLQMLKWMYPWREMKRLEIVTELENFILKTWRLIVTEAPVQMPLLFIGQCVPKANELPYGSLQIWRTHAWEHCCLG